MIELKKILLYSSIIMLTVLSCNNNLEKDLIAGKRYKLWLKVDLDEAKRGVKTFYYFGKDGRFQYFRKYKNSNIIQKLDMGDVMPNENWGLLADHKIKISGRVYDILLLNDSSFVYSKAILNSSHKVELIYEGDVLTE